MKIKIIVNAIPLINIKTGIGRYIEGLYSELKKYNNLDIWYFDGKKITKTFPTPPEIKKWSKMVNLFWKLPDNLSYFIRLFNHNLREISFKKHSKIFTIYHETAFFPFKSNIPTIFTIHDVSLIKFPEFHPRERVLYFNNFFYKRIKDINRIITVSNFTKQELLQHIDVPEKKIVTIHLGYNSKIFKKYSYKESYNTLKKYNIKKPYFLFVGTNDPRKNLELIEKVANLTSYKIYVVGWQGWGEKIKNLNYLGYISDIELAHLYNNAKALLFPSFYEGFGLPVLEAMACGLPVIVSKKASIPEVAGEAGIYLDNLKNPLHLKEKMDFLVNNPGFYKIYSGKSINQAKKFSWEKAAKATLDNIYLTLKIF